MPPDNKRFFVVLIIFVLAGAASLWISSRGRVWEIPPLPPFLPNNYQGWVGTPFSAVLPSDIRAGDAILREYRFEGKAPIKVMALYSPTGNYHPPSLCYTGMGLKLFYLPPLKNTSGKIHLSGLGAREIGQLIMVFHGFYLNGQIIPDGVRKKLYEVKDQFLFGKVRQYFFEMMVAVPEGEEKKGREYLISFLDTLEPYLLWEKKVAKKQ